MPTNRFIYLGTLLVAASVLIWLGAELTKRITWFLPYSGAVGAVLILVGLCIELRRRQNASAKLPVEPGP